MQPLALLALAAGGLWLLFRPRGPDPGPAQPSGGPGADQDTPAPPSAALDGTAELMEFNRNSQYSKGALFGEWRVLEPGRGEVNTRFRMPGGPILPEGTVLLSVPTGAVAVIQRISEGDPPFFGLVITTPGEGFWTEVGALTWEPSGWDTSAEFRRGGLLGPR